MSRSMPNSTGADQSQALPQNSSCVKKEFKTQVRTTVSGNIGIQIKKGIIYTLQILYGRIQSEGSAMRSSV